MTTKRPPLPPRGTAPRIAVIGGGIAGLTAALESAAAGAEVIVLEKNAHLGGKIFAADVEGRKIDMGPTVLTMRWVFDLVFRDVGAAFDDYVRLVPADIVARHAWEDGSRLDLYFDEERSEQAVAAFAGAREARGYAAFSRYARRIYENAYRTFMAAEGPSLRDMAAASGVRGMTAVFRIDPFRTMHRALRSFFKDERLIQLFARYATYYGASPYRAPATLHLIAEVERQGVWLPKDGMPAVARALHRAAESFGAVFRTTAGVRRVEVENGRVAGVVLDDESRIAADAVIFNGDAAAPSAGALGASVRRAVRRQASNRRSLSALVTAFVARADGFPLRSHNVFFPKDDYRKEFEEIFQRRALPSSPAVYVRAQDRDAGAPPPNGERFFTIVNAPPLHREGDALSETEIKRCLEAQYTLLERIGLTVRPAGETRRITPFEFARRFPHSGGALYGPVTHSPFAALGRAGVRTKVPGFYLAGGTIHPGAGVPTAALSGRQAARAVLSDLGLNGPSPLRDTLGGISTPSATTGGTG